MSDLQKTLDNGKIFPETTKLLREIHNIKVNETYEDKQINFNKYFHNKDEKLKT